jgi:hypothetical protein
MSDDKIRQFVPKSGQRQGEGLHIADDLQPVAAFIQEHIKDTMDDLAGKKGFDWSAVHSPMTDEQIESGVQLLMMRDGLSEDEARASVVATEARITQGIEMAGSAQLDNAHTSLQEARAYLRHLAQGNYRPIVELIDETITAGELVLQNAFVRNNPTQVALCEAMLARRRSLKALLLQKMGQ